ncbi:hypothetical protein LguiA_017823 [Lonicera macranthoides]
MHQMYSLLQISSLWPPLFLSIPNYIYPEIIIVLYIYIHIRLFSPDAQLVVWQPYCIVINSERCWPPRLE